MYSDICVLRANGKRICIWCYLSFRWYCCWLRPNSFHVQHSELRHSRTPVDYATALVFYSSSFTEDPAIAQKVFCSLVNIHSCFRKYLLSSGVFAHSKRSERYFSSRAVHKRFPLLISCLMLVWDWEQQYCCLNRKTKKGMVVDTKTCFVIENVSLCPCITVTQRIIIIITSLS